MASKKSSVEKVASKSVEVMSKEILDLQQRTREALSTIDGAFVEKQDELRNLLEVIQEKRDELQTLFGQEQILKTMQQLQEDLEDRRHSNDRMIGKMAQDFEDARAEQVRQQKMAGLAYQQKMADEERTRKIKQEDEDRARNLAYQEQVDFLNRMKADLEAKDAELGNFDDAVKAKVEKQVGAIKREMKFEAEKKAAEDRAVQEILEAKVKALVEENTNLKAQLATAQAAAEAAAAKAHAIAVAAMDKDAGKQALEEVRSMAHQMAGAPRK